MIMRPLCRHCGLRNINRPRGLCWPCFKIPRIRDLYPSTSIYARRGQANRRGPAPYPTRAAPGSPEKLLVMEKRAAKGYDLHHPHDAGWEVIVEKLMAAFAASMDQPPTPDEDCL